MAVHFRIPKVTADGHAIVNPGTLRPFGEPFLDEAAHVGGLTDRRAAAGEREELLHEVLRLHRGLARGAEFLHARRVGGEVHLGEREVA